MVRFDTHCCVSVCFYVLGGVGVGSLHSVSKFNLHNAMV